MVKNFELNDLVDDLGQGYLFILLASGAIWAFIAINNFDTPNIFRLALIYSILLIFGLLAISYDRRTQQLGIDTRIWQGKNIKQQLLIGIGVFAIWYLVFINSGFSVATASTVSGGVFSISPTLNYVLTSVLGPLAENVFFFGFLNITLIFVLRKLLEDRPKSIVAALLLFATQPLFRNVPNSTLFLGISSAAIILAALTQNDTLKKHAPVIASAFFIGGTVFPRFHSYAYQLNEQNYIAATWFGIIMCALAWYVGIAVVDLNHIGNNAVVAAGLVGG